ncbi:MAG TPA: ChaN family lipoprotein, partial [Desulfobacterales bacterium]|nr:ChaN family lipoprotein [Desulfobacterales bacterium]
MTKLRDQLIRIQKKNYRRNLNLVRESSGYNLGIKIYEKEYLRYLKSYEEISNKTELIQKVLTADLVYHGDYHTLKQSQHSVLRILREIKGKRDIILCLEMFHGRDQKYIDRFMAGELSEKLFLEAIDYTRKWPFHWGNWSPIISFCRDNQIPTLGINAEMDDVKGIKRLRKRDQYSARVIAKVLIKNPGKLIYIVDGDYHIAPNHLPKNVEQLLTLLDESAKTLIIFQNAENLYWKLCKRKLEESDVLKINNYKYCVMNTMPANKIQSYLNWLEYSKDAYFPVHQDWENDAFEDRGGMVNEMVTSLATILNLDFPLDALEKLTIYYPSDLDFMEFVHSTPEFKGRLRLIRSKIKKE